MNTIQWLELAKAKTDHRPVLCNCGLSGEMTVASDGFRLHVFDGILPVKVTSDMRYPDAVAIVNMVKKHRSKVITRETLQIFGDPANPHKLPFVLVGNGVCVDPGFVLDVLKFNGKATLFYSEPGCPVYAQVDELHSAVIMPISFEPKLTDFHQINMRQLELIKRLLLVDDIDTAHRYGDYIYGEDEDKSDWQWERRVTTLKMRIKQQYRKAHESIQEPQP